MLSKSQRSKQCGILVWTGCSTSHKLSRSTNCIMVKCFSAMGNVIWQKNGLKSMLIDVPGDMRGQYLVKACDYEDELRTKNSGIYEIAHMHFNSNLDDIKPRIFQTRDRICLRKRPRYCCEKKSWLDRKSIFLNYILSKQSK